MTAFELLKDMHLSETPMLYKYRVVKKDKTYNNYLLVWMHNNKIRVVEIEPKFAKSYSFPMLYNAAATLG